MAGSRIVGGALQTPYEDAAISGVDQAGVGVNPRGGRDTDQSVGGPGLVNSPFDEAALETVSPTGETPNSMSGLSRRVDGASMGPGDPGESGGVSIPALDKDNRGRTLD